MAYSGIEVMRDDISRVYNGLRWKTKVQHMRDDQVFAIWCKFNAEGRFDEKEPQKKAKIHNTKRAEHAVTNEEPQYEQLAFDLTGL